jgi:hypothetical protein
MLALASTIDVVAAKSLLRPETAGLYAQLSTAGKIPYFATVPVAIISFERLMKRIGKRRHIVAFYSGLLVALTFATIFFEPIIMRLFFGLSTDKYTSSTFLMTCLAFSSYSLTTLLVYSLISHRRLLRVGVIAAASLILPLVLIFTGVNNIEDIARSYMIGQLGALLIAAALQYTGSHE